MYMFLPQNSILFYLWKAIVFFYPTVNTVQTNLHSETCTETLMCCQRCSDDYISKKSVMVCKLVTINKLVRFLNSLVLNQHLLSP